LREYSIKKMSALTRGGCCDIIFFAFLAVGPTYFMIVQTQTVKIAISHF